MPFRGKSMRFTTCTTTVIRLWALEFNAHHFASKSSNVHSSLPTTKLAAASLHNRNFVASSLGIVHGRWYFTTLTSMYSRRDRYLHDIYFNGFHRTSRRHQRDILSLQFFRYPQFLSFPVVLYEKRLEKIL